MQKILLEIDHPENRRLLKEWLGGSFEVSVNGDVAETPFDLCILDAHALARLQDELEARKKHDAPLFLPLLLAVPHTPLPDKVWSSVDEVIFVPTEKAELRERINNLLRTRGLSQELNRRYEALQQYDRQKDEFLSVITHELKSPLTSILGYAEMLEDHIAGPLSEGQLEFVKQIESGTERVNRLVADLLDFARVETGTFKLRLEQGDLRDRIEEAMASMRPQAEAGRIRLEVELPDAPLPMAHDPQRLVQVFVNLVGNALKFTPPDGRITLRARREDGSVRCEVADSGPGIAPQDIPRLFRRFSQLEAGQQRGGSGLGLSICKTIVEAHGGQIGVTSTPGQGATFWFTLPLTPPEASP